MQTSSRRGARKDKFAELATLNEKKMLRTILWLTLFHSTYCGCLLPALYFPNGTVTLPDGSDVENKTVVVQELFVMKFECSDGFILIGSESIQCVDDQWTSQVPFCAGNNCPSPPFVENATYTTEDAEPVIGSTAVYACKYGHEMVNPDASTLRCAVNTQSRVSVWEGETPVCEGFFDTTFTVIKKRWNKITCYSNKTHQMIGFSRLLDTGKGESVPRKAVTNISNQSTVIDFSGVDYRDGFGVYKCHMKVHSKSMEIVVPWHSASIFSFFPDLTKVANSGDTVALSLDVKFFRNTTNLRWRHNGMPVRSWDDQRIVEIVDVKPEDKGIYECYYVGTRDDPHSLLRLIVRKCGKNLYGEFCDRKCPTCYNGGICQDILGICVCPPGFTGNNCEFACDKNRYGVDCSQECPFASCSYHVFCMSDPYGCSCAPGYSGLICGDGCRVGTYGADCKQSCHCANGPYSCDKYTGVCSGGCSLGWTGPSCQMKGFFDSSFIVMSNSPHRITCFSDENYENIRFSKVVGLESAKGLPLNSTTNTSEQAAILDFSTVDFPVQPGVYECGIRVHNWSDVIVFPYQGSNGSLYAPHPTKVANIGDTVLLEVRSYSETPPVTWLREGVRVPSWDGQLKVEIRNFQPEDSGIYECQLSLRTVELRAYLRLLLKKCREFLYGDHCDMKCPTCYNGGVCHELQGICICPPGFTGNNCEDACGENRFGADCSKVCPGRNCSGNLFCKPDPYGCSCAPGFKEFDCKESCEPGSYGADCKQTCHCAEGSCNIYTGVCSGGCSPGWSGQSCQIPDLGTCVSDPPPLLHGKPLKFHRKHKSIVQYECDRDFAMTGNSTVTCENGKWDGQPPICSFFDTTFTLVAETFSLTCYSDRYFQRIAFSRVLDTGSGGGLPTNATTRREEGTAVLDLSAVQIQSSAGAYECRIEAENRSVGIVVPFGDYFGYSDFDRRSRVANIGDTVRLEVKTFSSADRLRWRRNGVLVRSWDDRRMLEIVGVQPDDAGIYECYEEGERSERRALLRLIVRKCGKNRYAENCEQECPVCYNGGICHDILGVCVCPQGFTGKNCEYACGGNHMSADCGKFCTGSGCRNDWFCKPDPYGCSCFPGWRGWLCDDRCKPGSYGADCKQTCHCAERSCNIYTGACSGGCSPGWSGQSCQIPELCSHAENRIM